MRWFDSNIDENGGFRPTYEDIFTSIEETKVSETWPVLLDPDEGHS